MPRKPRGLLGRLGSAVGRLTHFFGKKPAVPEAPPGPPPREPSPQGPGLRPPPSIPLETRYLEKYVKVTGGILDFPDWMELWEPLSIIFDTDAEKARYFEMFLRAYYLTTHEDGHITRERFHQISSIPPFTDSGVNSQIGWDWDEWREMRRGTP